MTLVLFDLDNTLIGGDSDYLWGEFLVSRELVDVQSYRQRNADFYRDYEEGHLNVADYLQFALAPLTRFDRHRLTQLHAEFMREAIDPIWLPKAEQLVNKHRQAGDQLVVITSTNRFVVEPIVAKLGINHLVCSEPQILDGRYTGDFVGTPCFAEGKITKIREWLGEAASLDTAWFYSDSHNDLPLMRIVGNAVAVDPDDKLKSEAESHGWEIISLR